MGKRSFISKFAIFAFFAFIFVLFFNGYSNEGPSRKKFKRLGNDAGVEDLTKVEEAKPEVNLLKGISKDSHFKEWTEWWQKCSPGLEIDRLEGIGSSPMHDLPIDYLTDAQMSDGPGKMFYLRSPNGKYYANPFYKRLQYKNEGGSWQPYIEVPCGVAVYAAKTKWARNVMECSSLEGIDDAFWKGELLVLMGYSSVSRQMNVECEGVESCATPTVWILDFKNNTQYEYHGSLIKRKGCELGGYLRVRLPKFFGKEK